MNMEMDEDTRDTRREVGDDEVFSGGGFVKADDIAEMGPEEVTIKGVRIGNFDGKDKAILLLTDGREVTLNGTRERQLKALTPGGRLVGSAVKGLPVRLTVARVQGPSGGKVNSIQIEKSQAAGF